MDSKEIISYLEKKVLVKKLCKSLNNLKLIMHLLLSPNKTFTELEFYRFNNNQFNWVLFTNVEIDLHICLICLPAVVENTHFQN